MVACKATGVDLDKFREVISAGGGNSGIFQMVVPAILDEGSFEGMKFSLANAAKDLGYFTEMADASGLQVPLATDVRDALLAAVEHRPDGLVAALVEVAAKQNGLTIGME
jgi:3-hydroxyisobutyrate dehydrogenase-like beta-hydroxyacid dehydrogenase